MIAMRNDAVFPIFILLFTVLLGGCDKSAEEAETMIKSSEALTALDARCAEIPKPDSFTYIRKDVSGNSRLDIIEHRFASKEPFASVKEFYSKWFYEHGWYSNSAFDLEKLKGLKYPVFVKDGVSVSIGRSPFPGADYLDRKSVV